MDVGTVTVSDVSWDYNGPENFPRGCQYSWSTPWDGSIMPTLGSTGTWAIEGNVQESIPAINTQMYVPQEIILSAPDLNDPVVSRTNGVTLAWNVDPSNSLGVLIGVTKRIPTSSPSPDGEFLKPWHTITPDDGEFHVPGSAIEQIEYSEGVEIAIIRGNLTYIEVDGKNYLLNALITHSFGADVEE